MPSPITLVCAGAGGVGKTTSSAAIALACARAGYRTLVVTVDPARRLADALGVSVGTSVQTVALPGLPPDKLFSLMPDPADATPAFAGVLFEHNVVAHQRVLNNRIYQTLAQAAPGMHEIVCLTLIARATEAQNFDVVVIDTAPSRNALDFIGYPGRLATLFEGRAVAFISDLASRGVNTMGSSSLLGLFASMEKRMEGVLARILSAEVLESLGQLFGDLSSVKDRFAELSRTAERLLLGRQTRYVLVAAPTQASESDALFLHKKIETLGQKSSVVLLNRADQSPPRWLTEIDRVGLDNKPNLSQALSNVRVEYEARGHQADHSFAHFGKMIPGATRLRLPSISSLDPAAIVEQLSRELETHLPVLIGGLAPRNT